MQTGTDASCNSHGRATHHVWYEILPAPAVTLDLAIRPGDLVTASVNLRDSGTSVMLQVKNRTTHQSATRTLAVAGGNALSAEWIAEAPSRCNAFWCKTMPLANFGSVSFTRIAAIGDGHPGTITDPAWAAAPIRLVSRPGAEAFPGGPRPERLSATPGAGAVPGPLDPAGRSFTVSWRQPSAV
jgi:hypothetical protein